MFSFILFTCLIWPNFCCTISLVTRYCVFSCFYQCDYFSIALDFKLSPFYYVSCTSQLCINTRTLFYFCTYFMTQYFLGTEFIKSTPTYYLLLPEIFNFIPESLSLYHNVSIIPPFINILPNILVQLFLLFSIKFIHRHKIKVMIPCQPNQICNIQ